MFKKDTKRRFKKKISIRKKISGTSQRPRLVVNRSLKQIYAQVIDDQEGKTLVAASSLSKEIAEEIKKAQGNIGKSKEVGKLLAKKALEAGISEVIFDRAGYRYHGRVKALADGAREGGIKF